MAWAVERVSGASSRRSRRSRSRAARTAAAKSGRSWKAGAQASNAAATSRPVRLVGVGSSSSAPALGSTSVLGSRSSRRAAVLAVDGGAVSPAAGSRAVASRTSSGSPGSVAVGDLEERVDPVALERQREARRPERTPGGQRRHDRRQELAVRPGQDRGRAVTVGPAGEHPGPAGRVVVAVGCQHESARRPGPGPDPLGEPFAVAGDEADRPLDDRGAGSGSW